MRDRRTLVEPPEELGRPKAPPLLRGPPPGRHVERLGLDQCVRLLPEPDLAGLAEEPAVADNAVARRRAAGQEARLGRAGDRGHHLAKPAAPATACQGPQPGRPGKESPRQADRVDQDQGSNVVQSPLTFDEP